MSYTAPTTRVTGTLITASIWNTDIVDNIIALRATDTDYVHVRDEKASGTAGGTFTQAAWRQRDLNTEVSDVNAIASVASNRVTLAAGTYRCRISAPAHSVGGPHRARLYDNTGAAELLKGGTSGTAGANIVTHAMVVGRFVLAVQSDLQIEHYCNATKATDGFGIAITIAAYNEIFSEAEFWRIAT